MLFFCLWRITHKHFLFNVPESWFEFANCALFFPVFASVFLLPPPPPAHWGRGVQEPACGQRGSGGNTSDNKPSWSPSQTSHISNAAHINDTKLKCNIEKTPLFYSVSTSVSTAVNPPDTHEIISEWWITDLGIKATALLEEGWNCVYSIHHVAQVLTPFL